ncbi:MAG TPA: 23S rRNA (pseudouridine(1915)-N(3))-methyltransferase RlmH [Blastocatellia bacterium]|nr:23S rRNA (pseudouridine(1915)-N(3))-methyltransferase RlmH [Blastocatellia bacterium]HMV86042.1 23S rRNA (pseudouridine(1915)-N(3))-methyltransferase RlmH [Blastocatellia bacterium]HMX28071.1 23S rRNA (pseudouridine(1915)-N(3))-methyltransferase RlmH [Blastocatellia bacterium]HMY70255.1 23S rRNA (pseudouridine(1915)-N(3))-methyltransferase RlmH [Blastocatellia bacterium]HMZ19615.1 23S rRNA (pseudouridine(1915)-N(3))-methyltransferase RlmH [Blastocatellia bacterium]
MKIHFVWIGKTKDRHCAALTADYLDRIKRFAGCEVSELKEQSGGEESRVIAAEGVKLLGAIEKDDFIVLLDERGRELTSPQLAEFVSARQQAGIKRLAFVIGGFAGVAEAVKQRANVQLSLSRMTLTHELARVILTEQIYRAFTLLAGLPYHKF